MKWVKSSEDFLIVTPTLSEKMKIPFHHTQQKINLKVVEAKQVQFLL